MYTSNVGHAEGTATCGRIKTTLLKCDSVISDTKLWDVYNWLPHLSQPHLSESCTAFSVDPCAFFFIRLSLPYMGNSPGDTWRERERVCVCEVCVSLNECKRVQNEATPAYSCTMMRYSTTSVISWTFWCVVVACERITHSPDRTA